MAARGWDGSVAQADGALLVPDFTFLRSTELDWQPLFGWAKKLVEDLNRKFQDLSGAAQAAPVGASMMWLGATAPSGWLLEDGSSYSKFTYPALFLVLGYTYGGSGNNFNVRDMRNKLPIGAGALCALNATAGASTVAIATANLPAHSHPVTDPGHVHVLHDPGHVHTGGVSAGPTITAGGVANQGTAGNTGSSVNGITIDPVVTGITTQNVGGGTALPILNPVVGTNFIVKT